MGCSSSSACPVAERVETPSELADQYAVGRLLGEGQYGKVFSLQKKKGSTTSTVHLTRSCQQATSIATASGPLCVKIVEAENISASDVDSPKSSRSRGVETEVESWRRIGEHAHCVKLVHAFAHPTAWYMVMEACAGSFADETRRVQMLLETDSTRIFTEMCESVAHLHQVGIVHRDIKVDNFLLGGPGGSTVKLGDFGFATTMPSDKMLTRLCGTAPYMSPEMVARVGYDYKTDVWSLGGVMHMLIMGDYPYSRHVANGSSAAMKEAIMNDSPRLNLTWASGLDGSFSFIQCMLQRDPQCRASAEEILQLVSGRRLTSVSQMRAHALTTWCDAASAEEMGSVSRTCTTKSGSSSGDARTFTRSTTPPSEETPEEYPVPKYFRR
eukprot:TRINITY_DN56589_c0_g1_i1.p1 TRINITY_DN56589_c0_g1~~TRINITY_DN56589_c0_g1_i1.p1  ORF type:complete len:398 (-),score=51.01 TRINITY_DN56589_c0_g1_i1:391-1542(-)